MDFSLTDDQRLLQEGAARYFEKSYGFAARLELARSGGGFARSTWRAFAEMGWLAAAVPQERGGLGFGPIELALIAEECGRHLVLEPFTACGVLPALLLAQLDASVPADTALAAIAAGETLYAVAHSEAESRGDVLWVAASAERLADGRWRLRGRKTLVVGAGVADRLLVVARCAGAPGAAEGLVVFDVAAGAPGLCLERYALVDGTPAADLVLDDAMVAADALRGEAGAVAGALQKAIDTAIVLQCAEMVGDIEDVLALCSEYLKTRRQFGVPIGSFQALQHRMADMAIEAVQARASLHRGLQALTVGDAARCSVDVSGVKAQVLKSARFVTQQGIQLHGGYGITEEYRVGHHWRRQLLTDSLWGNGAHHLRRYASRIQQEAAAS